MKAKIYIIIICNLVICNLLISQNITNTIGTSGLFTVKDASINYLTLTQSTGQVNILRTLRLENTTSSTTGIIFKGASRFLHNYGTNNAFLGINSGNFTMMGSDDTGLGNFSLTNNSFGNQNTAVGVQSLNSNTSGSFNTAVGMWSLYVNTGGTYNTAVGMWSLYLSNGANNTAMGFFSLRTTTSGANNTAVGSQSLFNNNGDNNSALGFTTGSTITSGVNLTCIGYGAEPTTGSAVNQITLGNATVTSLRCNVTTITSLSDMRDKKNISDLDLGIDFLMKIKPRLFNWDKREWYEGNVSDGTKMQETPTAGFIAQELDEAQTTGNAEWLNLVLKDNPEKWEATSGNLLPVMVKAIQRIK